MTRSSKPMGTRVRKKALRHPERKAAATGTPVVRNEQDLDRLLEEAKELRRQWEEKEPRKRPAAAGPERPLVYVF